MVSGHSGHRRSCSVFGRGPNNDGFIEIHHAPRQLDTVGVSESAIDPEQPARAVVNTELINGRHDITGLEQLAILLTPVPSYCLL